jgi:hypothetical protein
MLQWRPGSACELIWNDREGDRFVCHILNMTSGLRRTVPGAIYTLSPDGRMALGIDFQRVNDMRPGYGYAGLADPNAYQLAPRNAGICRFDLETGEYRLVVSLADIAAIPYPHANLSGAKHYFNHLLFNPAGSRFAFLHRWRFVRSSGVSSFQTRMLTAAPDGTDIRVVDDSGDTSHFIWRDASHILSWTCPPDRGPGFYLFDDDTGRIEPVGEGRMTENGHCSYLPGGEWILNDTYPDEQGFQQLYIYHVGRGERILLGDFYAPPDYRGEWRCDLHPRCDPDGKWVAIDSVHEGLGRQMYLVDLGDLALAC